MFYLRLSRVLIWGALFWFGFFFPISRPGNAASKVIFQAKDLPFPPGSQWGHILFATVHEIINQGVGEYLLVNTVKINRIVSFFSAIRQLRVPSLLVWESQLQRQGGKLSPLRWKGVCTIYQADCSVISVEGPWRALTMRLKVGTNLLQHKCIEQERESS